MSAYTEELIEKILQLESEHEHFSHGSLQESTCELCKHLVSLRKNLAEANALLNDGRKVIKG